MPGILRRGGLYLADYHHSPGLLSWQCEGLHCLHLSPKQTDGLLCRRRFDRAVRSLQSGKHPAHFHKRQAVFRQYPEIRHSPGSCQVKLFPELPPGCFLCPGMESGVLLSQAAA